VIQYTVSALSLTIFLSQNALFKEIDLLWEGYTRHFDPRTGLRSFSFVHLDYVKGALVLRTTSENQRQTPTVRAPNCKFVYSIINPQQTLTGFHSPVKEQIIYMVIHSHIIPDIKREGIAVTSTHLGRSFTRTCVHPSPTMITIDGSSSD
jgi:hypothetical protein